MSRWSKMTDTARGHDYDKRWERMAEAGESIHGEADLVELLLGGCDGRSVLDAGCGTGRVAIELARRGAEVVGVDLDAAMLAAARDKAPQLRWIHGDICHVVIAAGAAGEQATTADDPAKPQRFDLVVMAGNVVIFLAPGSEPRALANLAGMLLPGGLLVAGFQLGPGRVGVDLYDRWAEAAGLCLVDRWAAWDGQPFTAGDYAVSVHAVRATLA